MPRIPDIPDLPPLPPPRPPIGIPPMPPGPPIGIPPMPPIEPKKPERPSGRPPYNPPKWQYGGRFWGQERGYWEENPGFLIERMLQELAPDASMDVADFIRRRLWTGYNAWRLFGTVQTAIGRGAEERAPLGDVLHTFMGGGRLPMEGGEQSWARRIGSLLFANRGNPVVTSYLKDLNESDPENAVQLAAWAGGLPPWMTRQLARNATTLRQQYGGQGAPSYLDFLWRRLVR